MCAIMLPLQHKFKSKDALRLTVQIGKCVRRANINFSAVMPQVSTQKESNEANPHFSLGGEWGSALLHYTPIMIIEILASYRYSRFI